MKRATLLLLHGYIGFGKTTIAKKFEELGYKRFTHDEYMSDLFGDHPSDEDFMSNYNKATTVIFDKVKKELSKGNNVILDFGFWSKKSRDDIWYELNHWPCFNDISVIWINVRCNIKTARKRCVDRDKKRKKGELWVPVEVFDAKLDQFEPMDDFEDWKYTTINIDN